MNPLVVKMMTGVVRTVLVAYAADYVAPEQYEAIAQALSVLAVGAWSAYDKWREQRKLVTALASPVKMSEAAVSAKIASGLASPAMTASQDIPVQLLPEGL